MPSGMVSIGTPKSPHATRVLLLGSGELGKEVVIELQRFGVEVIACDRYADAPAMQVAHRSHVIDMLDRSALRTVVDRDARAARARERGLDRDPDGAGGAPDDGSRGDPPRRRRATRPADRTLPV